MLENGIVTRGSCGKIGLRNRIKSLYRNETSLSLKQFARKLALEGDETAKIWLSNKKGFTIKAAKATREKERGAKIREISMATHVWRRRKKSGVALPTPDTKKRG